MAVGNIEKGSIIDWRIKKEAKEILGLGDAEYKEYDITEEDGVIRWKNKEEAEKEKEYDIPQRAYELLVAHFKEMDGKKSFPSSEYAETAAKLLEV